MFKVKLFGLSSKYFLFVFLTSVSFYAPTVANATDNGGGGSNTGTGGGLAEARIAYSYIALDKFIQLCKASASCVTNQAEASYLDELASQTKEERKSVKPRFKSEKEDPGFFVDDGIEKPFRAEPRFRSDVWFNLDMIYVPGPSNIVKALPMKDLLALVATAFAIHVPGTLPESQKASLFKRLAEVPSQSLLEVHANAVGWQPEFGAVGYVERLAEGRLFTVAVSDYQSAFEQTEIMTGILNAALSSGEAGDVTVKKSRLLQATWTNPDYESEVITSDLVLKAQIEILAQDGTSVSRRCQLSFAARFDRSPVEGSRAYLLNTEVSHWTATCN